jgi:indolepyruvate ferredoxin oxidoreductase, beta subunit
MKQFSIYLSGVGGQGIGLLSETLLRAADHAGHKAKGVDTHGLAQRGGSVVSQIRIGSQVHTPLVSRHQADLLISLERHEALRSLTEFAKEGATLIYYNAVWQPLDVRLASVAETSSKYLGDLCLRMGVKCVEVFHPDLEDTRMQNVALLARIDREGVVPGVKSDHYRKALADLMAGSMLEKNMALYELLRTTV